MTYLKRRNPSVGYEHDEGLSKFLLSSNIDLIFLFPVIEQIRDRAAELAETLANFVEDFEYDNMLALLDPLEKEKSHGA